MKDEYVERRVNIAERKRVELAAWRKRRPNAATNAAIRKAVKEARDGGKKEVAVEVEIPSMDDIRAAEDTWVRYQVAREVLLAEGKKATDSQVAESLGLEDGDRTVRRWRQEWRRMRLPPG